jgi:hypothetical protein
VLCQTFLPDFNQIRILSTDFHRSPQHQFHNNHCSASHVNTCGYMDKKIDERADKKLMGAFCACSNRLKTGFLNSIKQSHVQTRNIGHLTSYKREP